MPTFVGLVDVTYNCGLNLASTMNEHAQPMSRRLIARAIMGQNERNIYSMFICIRKKVPLLLRLVMDFVGTGAKTAELKEVVSRRNTNRNGGPTHMLWKVVGGGVRRGLIDGKDR
jgi:hypothetical protein